MSAFDEAQFDDLLSRYLDEGLGETEEHSLAECLTDENLARRFLEMTKLNAEIAGLSAAPVPDTVMAELVLSDLRGGSDNDLLTPSMPDYTIERSEDSVSVRPGKKFLTAPWLALVACFCLLMVPVFYFAHLPANHSASSVTVVSGEVYFVNSTGKTPLTGSLPLKGDGKIETVGADSRATVILEDGTRLDLAGNSVLTTELEHDGHRLVLEGGTMRAHVAKQPGTSKLIFSTMNSDTTVHGTQFILSVVNSTTYVIVTEGAVSVGRPGENTEVRVESGFYTHVEEKGNFLAWPNNRLPKALRDEIKLEK